jgi:hypothetical protein
MMHPLQEASMKHPLQEASMMHPLLRLLDACSGFPAIKFALAVAVDPLEAV